MKQKINYLGRMAFLLLVALPPYSCLTAFLPASAQTQAPAAPLPSIEPLETDLLEEDAPLASRNVIRADTIYEKGLTVPSLWWAKEQFAGKLLTTWLAYPKEGRVDLVVNQQLWTLLDYLDRYRFINNFGTVARDYGYNIRVFNPQNPSAPLAAYTCNLSTTQPNCQIWLDSSGGNGLGVPTTPENQPFQ